MRYVVFEDAGRQSMLPLTYLRPVYELRCGLCTFRERWQLLLGEEVGAATLEYLAPVWESIPSDPDILWINGRLFPDETLRSLLREVPPRSFVWDKDQRILFARFPGDAYPAMRGKVFTPELLERIGLKAVQVHHDPRMISRPRDLYILNRTWIEHDFSWMAGNMDAGEIRDPYTCVYGKDNVFVHPSARVRAAIINAEEGPVFIGPGVKIEEGAIIQGAHGFLEGAIVALGAKLRGDSTLGPSVKAGGEIKNTVFQGYANKSHDGYLGNAFIGEGCNLGALTTASNLKNNFAPLKSWDYPTHSWKKLELTMGGPIMGDYTRTGIHTTLNTGAEIGVSTHIFGPGFPPTFIPSFSWGGAQGLETFRLEKAINIARHMARSKGLDFPPEMEGIFAHVFEESARLRKLHFSG